MLSKGIVDLLVKHNCTLSQRLGCGLLNNKPKEGNTLIAALCLRVVVHPLQSITCKVKP